MAKSIKDINGVVPENIRRITMERGMKQCAVEKMAGLKPHTITNYLNGRKIIKPSDLAHIAAVLNVEPNDLFEGYVSKED